jgi:arsenite-transporting ATPase
VVVDTAPTGHTLRLLDAAELIDSWAAVFSAMADKVATIAMTMVNARVRLPGEDAIEEMRSTAQSFRDALRNAEIILVTRESDVVLAESQRLANEIRKRDLRIAAVVVVRTNEVPVTREEDAGIRRLLQGDSGAALIHAPRLKYATGCESLRAWSAGAAASHDTTRDDGPMDAPAERREGAAAFAAKQSGRGWLTSHTQKLFWFAGKGGVGKSTCACAAALALSDTRDVLICSTDPAGSLREVLAVDGQLAGGAVAPRLRALQVDAAAQLDEWRSRYRTEADQMLDSLGVGGSATMDRNIMSAIWDAVPPGIDELFALGEILDAADTDQVIVVDAAPTGHFLRLIESPETALEWTHAILRILLKYGVAGAMEGLSERVLAFARQLKHLRAMMTDPAACGVMLVGLDEPIIRAQTARLAADVEHSGMHVLGMVCNCTTTAAPFDSIRAAKVVAPRMAPPPTGIAGLTAFINEWRVA